MKYPSLEEMIEEINSYHWCPKVTTTNIEEVKKAYDYYLNVRWDHCEDDGLEQDIFLPNLGCK